MSRVSRTTVILAAAAAAGLMLTAAQASAALTTVDYSAGTDGDFATATNWNTGYVPGSTADQNETYIMNGHTVTLNTDLSASSNYRNFQINNGFNFQQNNPTPGTTLTIGPSGVLNGPQSMTLGIQGTINLNGGSYTGGGTTIGTVDGYHGINTGQATFNVTGGNWAMGNLRGVGPSSGGRFTVGSNGTGVFSFTGGMLVTGDYGGVHLGEGTPYTYSSGGNSYTQTCDGTINQSGGELNTGRELIVGENAVGTYNLSGTGVLYAGYNGNGYMGIGVNGNGTFNQTGGTANISYRTVVGNGTGNGLLAISGGTFNKTGGASLYVGNTGGTGTGILRVIGSSASISLLADGGQTSLTSYANGTLNFQIDGGGVSTITATTPGFLNDSRSIISLAGTLDIDTLGGFEPTVGSTYDLITTTVTSGGGINAAGLSLAAADQAYWSFAVVNEGANNILRLTNTAPIPEPSMVMAGLSVVIPMMLRRKRRA